MKFKSILLLIILLATSIIVVNQVKTNKNMPAEPKNSSFVKEVVTQDECNNPIGVINYYDAETDSRMKVNNLLLPQNDLSKDGLSQIKSFLANNDLIPLQDIRPFEFPFHNYCGGSSNIYLKELSGITYPKTDKSRAIMVYTSQSPFGPITVFIFAQKNNDMIQLSKYLSDRSLYETILAACNIDLKNMGENVQEKENCYRDRLIQDQSLQSIAVSEANRLISLFELK